MRVLDHKICYLVRGPWEPGRASLSFIRSTKYDDGTKQAVQVSDRRIDALNEEIRTGRWNDAKKLADLKIAAYQVRDVLYKELSAQKGDKPIPAFNQAVLDDFIKEDIAERKATKHSTKQKDAADANRAVRLLGNHNIRTCKMSVLQDILNLQKTEAANLTLIKMYRRILKFVGRYKECDELHRRRYPEKRPPFLEWDQVKRVAKVPENWAKDYPLMADLIWVIYLLGLRISESFALEKSDIQVINKEEVATKKAQPLIALKIHQQYVRKQYAKGETDRLRELKNKRPRLATPLDQALFLKHFESWLKGTAVMKNSDPARIDPVATRQKRDTYRYALDRYLRDACRAMFQIEIEAQNSDDFFNLGAMPGTDDDREYKAAHMLRAGHAVYLMSVTKNVDLVANQIGDTVDVVRKHYSGRINTTMSMAEAAKLLAKAK